MTGSARAHRTARLVAGATLLLSYSGGCAVSAEVEHTTGGFSSATGGATGTGGSAATVTGGTVTSTGGVPAATGGTKASTGGTKSEGLGGTFSTGGVATGGTKASTGGSAVGGVSTTGGVAAGGKAGTTGGAGGALGGGGAGGGSAGKSAGGGADSCDWAGCSQKQCATACPTGMGDYCAMSCSAIIACVRANPTCGTAADPMCVKRNGGSASLCTTPWESGSGAASPPGPPAKVATDYFNCACGITPSGTGGATGAGGKAGSGGATGTGGKAGSGGATGTGGKAGTGGAGGKGA